MKIGYQGEEHSYSHQATTDVYPDAEAVGFAGFGDAFTALGQGSVERLILPIENSTTGSILEVLDRLTGVNASIVGEHYVVVRHALIGLPGTKSKDVRRVLSHPEALAQIRDTASGRGWDAVPVSDTAGAVREVAARGDPTWAALAPAESGEAHGLEILLSDVVDRVHNTTRFIVLAPGPPTISVDDNKSSVAFSTAHEPGALAGALTELGGRGANLTRIESRPGPSAWSYWFYVDLLHQPGPGGVNRVLRPRPAAMDRLHYLGTYRAAQPR